MNGRIKREVKKEKIIYKTKMDLHTELNEAYEKLLKICLFLDLRRYHETLERGRSFMTNTVNHYDDLPYV